jgi:hypothetical protein
MIDARAIAAALGGQVVGANKILCPGPGHSRRDRSLAVKLDAGAPDGFMCFSHAGDDWKACRDYVRSRLGLPAWQPGDHRQRSIPAHRVAAWDMAAEYCKTPIGDWHLLITKQIAPSTIPDKEIAGRILLGCHRFSEITRAMVSHLK